MAHFSARLLRLTAQDCDMLYFLINISHIIDSNLNKMQLLLLRLQVFWLWLQHVFISPVCEWVPMTSAFVTLFGFTWLWLVNKKWMARPLNLDELIIMDYELSIITLFFSCFDPTVYLMDIRLSQYTS